MNACGLAASWGSTILLSVPLFVGGTAKIVYKELFQYDLIHAYTRYFPEFSVKLLANNTDVYGLSELAIGWAVAVYGRKSAAAPAAALLLSAVFFYAHVRLLLDKATCSCFGQVTLASWQMACLTFVMLACAAFLVLFPRLPSSQAMARYEA